MFTYRKSHSVLLKGLYLWFPLHLLVIKYNKIAYTLLFSCFHLARLNFPVACCFIWPWYFLRGPSLLLSQQLYFLSSNRRGKSWNLLHVKQAIKRNNLTIRFGFPGKEQERVTSSPLAAGGLLPFLLLEHNVHKGTDPRAPYNQEEIMMPAGAYVLAPS